MTSSADHPPIPTNEPDELTEFLLRRESYPDATSRVELVETHISRVFLTDRFVYKLKKPVRFEFLDFSTLAARKQSCDDEVRLNRRMAHDAYLGVLPIARGADGRLSLEGPGEPIEWVVKMRRLDASRMLDRLIREDRLNDDDIAPLAHHLANYYASAPALRVNADDYHRSIVRHVRANRDDLLASCPDDLHESVRRIHAEQLEELFCNREMFDERVAEGKVIDGHGDLRPEHICLETPPVVYDCVEFSADFRRIDIADELCFLQMECELLGRADVGRAILDAYRRRAGEYLPDDLQEFYKSYRACVRGKVAALRARQQSDASQEASRNELRRYLHFAGRRVPPVWTSWTLYVMRGLMGTGKSTLAAALALETASERIRTDDVRRELFDDLPPEASFGGGKYGPEQKRLVYEEVLRRCERRLCDGQSVIADGMFLDDEALRKAAEVAATTGAQIVVVECRCSAELAKQRIAVRLARAADSSEARPELYDIQAGSMCAVPATLRCITVDTELPAEEQLALFWEGLQRPRKP
ncbi:MAG: hypothetical protein C0483_06330 [Pirellula sp.]|nr:hypothetical protein [Pirellula sp.]